MTAISAYNILGDAYGASTINDNIFAKAIDSVFAGCDSFFADGEYYFCANDFTFTTPSLNPFECDWKPCVMCADGSMLFL